MWCTLLTWKITINIRLLYQPDGWFSHRNADLCKIISEQDCPLGFTSLFNESIRTKCSTFCKIYKRKKENTVPASFYWEWTGSERCNYFDPTVSIVRFNVLCGFKESSRKNMSHTGSRYRKGDEYAYRIYEQDTKKNFNVTLMENIKRVTNMRIEYINWITGTKFYVMHW